MQERMFRLAVDSIDLNANHRGADGWQLRIGVRRGDESWHDVSFDVYDHLDTPELYDVIATQIAVALGLA